MSNEFFDELRRNVTEGDLETALTRLNEFSEGQGAMKANASGQLADLSSEVIVQLGRLRRSKRDYRSGSIDRDEHERTLLKMTAAILSIIKDFEQFAVRRVMPVRIFRIDTTKLNSPDEKLWGRNNIQSVAWLHKAISRSRSVCRIVSPEGLGTGFLIQGGYLLTNHHVIGTAENARNSIAEFNFEEDGFGAVSPVTSFKLDPSVFATDEALDCTIVGVSSTDGKQISDWGSLPINPKGTIEISEPVSIIQHPEGGLKKICVTSNEVVNVFEYRVQYMTGTLPGSSGSPVFNDKWNVIAIHHAGGELLKNASGQLIYANEGILMSEIAKNPKLSKFFAL